MNRESTYLLSYAYPIKYVIMTQEMRDQAEKPLTKKQFNEFKFMYNLRRNLYKDSALRDLILDSLNDSDSSR